jgi:hypothetical protein
MDAARAKRIVSLIQDFWPVELLDLGETPDLEKIRAMTVPELVYHWGGNGASFLRSLVHCAALLSMCSPGVFSGEQEHLEVPDFVGRSAEI